MKENLNLRTAHRIFLGLLITASTFFGLASCDDDPGVENYYTSTKNYAATFLQNDSNFSKFVEVLNRATGEKGTYRLMDLLGTYGSYTVFAPTNDAMKDFLRSKGVSSVAQLSKEDCDTLALNHIIEQAFFTSDYNNGTYPTANMLERYLTITCDSDTVSTPGKVKLLMRINKSGVISHPDDSVMNGVVHVVSKVIGTQNSMVPDMLKQDSTITLFYEALQATGWSSKLQEDFMDVEYENEKSARFDRDSVDWTNDKLVVETGLEWDNVAYMKHRYNKFTVFIERDDLYAANNINDLNDLREYAKSVYGPLYPEDADIDDETNPRNYLNRFVAYHILPFQSTYYQLTAVDGPNSTLATLFNRRKLDIADWYETCMPHSLMKFSFPGGAASGLYINRRGVMARADALGVFRPGIKVATPEQMPDNNAVNGVYYYIDNILTYNEDTQTNVISGERMRIDATTLSPDFLTSGARGHYTTAYSIENGKYGKSGQKQGAAGNCNHCLGFKGRFTKNFYFSDNITHVHVRNRVLSFWSYEGDEVTVLGRFDIAIKMPPVPEGEWEVRIFSCVGFDNRGIVQFYFGPGEIQENGKVDLSRVIACDIPFDMRTDGTNPRVGWKRDDDLGDEDAIIAFDRALRNRGWMKGMASYFAGQDDNGSSTQNPNRYFEKPLRKIITRFHSDGKSDYWLRMQQKLESEKGTMALDAVELCPSYIYNNEYVPEDRW